ncbi:MAG: hypothetical protein Q6J68_06825, partial [Thermostichales cyanobacterium SZTDM-1c_bins_54]
DPQRALASMTSTEMALISAETNTYWRLAPTPQIHEDFKSLIYLPYLQEGTQQRIIPADLPDSGRD